MGIRIDVSDRSYGCALLRQIIEFRTITVTERKTGLLVTWVLFTWDNPFQVWTKTRTTAICTPLLTEILTELCPSATSPVDICS